MLLFGLIGNPLTHSFSKNYFTEKFKKEGIEDCRYENFQLPDISQLPRVIADNPDLLGFNVTIPYKESILPFLAERSMSVEREWWEERNIPVVYRGMSDQASWCGAGRIKLPAIK